MVGLINGVEASDPGTELADSLEQHRRGTEDTLKKTGVDLTAAA